MASSNHKRILLKLSGEALMGNDAFGVNPEVIARISQEIGQAAAAGAQLGIVVGGGNIFRGVSSSAGNMDRAMADYMGMLATVMNAIALQEGIKRTGTIVHVMSGLPVGHVVKPFDRAKAIECLIQGHVVIFAAGTGNPFFTTDTAAALRGLEIDADVVIKATKVDGVYDKDPVKHADAVKYDRLTYDEVLAKRLGVMDATAIALCRDNGMPLRVLNMNKPGALLGIVKGTADGTLVEAE